MGDTIRLNLDECIQVLLRYTRKHTVQRLGAVTRSLTYTFPSIVIHMLTSFWSTTATSEEDLGNS